MASNAQKVRSGRLTGSLIGLSSAAIVSVYAAGYLNTQAADGTAGSQPANAASATANGGGNAVVAPSLAASSSTANSSSSVSSSPSSKSSASTAAYKDGTYTGTG